MNDALESALQGPPTSTSPIIVSIAEVSVDRCEKYPEVQRSLLIVSDMIQNSPFWSFYDDGMDFDRLKGSPNYHVLESALEGVAVTVFRIPRLDHNGEKQQSEEFCAFWAGYFQAQGADYRGMLNVASGRSVCP